MNTVSLQGYLTRLVWLCLLPPVLMASVFAVLQVRRQLAAQEQEAMAQARNMAIIFDRRLEARIAALQVLTASTRTNEPFDLQGMYQQAQEFRKNFGDHVIMADLSMQMLLNTRMDFGADLPKLPVPKGRAAAPLALATGKPAVGDLFYGPIAKEPLVAMVVPVMRAGAVKALLLSSIEASQFQQRLEEIAIPAGWSATLLDSTEATIARVTVSNAVQNPPETPAAWRFVSRLTVAPWSVALEIPYALFHQSVIRTTVILAGAILAITLLSLLTGWLASRRLRRAVNSLTLPTTPPVACLPAFSEIEAARKLLADEIVNRETAQQELRQSEQRYADLYENAPDMYLSIVAESGAIINCNNATTEITGYVKEELIGERVFTLYHPDSHDRAKSIFQTFTATGAIKDAELQIVGKNGRVLDVSLNASAVRDADGRILHSRSVWRDITERKRIEKELEEHRQNLEVLVKERTGELEKAQTALMNLVEELNDKAGVLKDANEKLQDLDRLKSLFIASMSHELRTPLNSIIGFSSILKEEWLGPVNAEQKENLAAVLEAGKHLLNLINDVIDLSKIEAGMLEASTARFALDDVMTEAVGMVAKAAADKGLALRNEPLAIELISDRRRFLQCLLNLLGNAVKYTDTGTIDISCRMLPAGPGVPAGVAVAVSDTGIGIKEEDLARLFQPFSRLHPPGAAGYPGTGLGLYLSQKLAREVLGGEITVESAAGQGSVFTLTIPVRMKETDEGSAS